MHTRIVQVVVAFGVVCSVVGALGAVPAAAEDEDGSSGPLGLFEAIAADGNDAFAESSSPGFKLFFETRED